MGGGAPYMYSNTSVSSDFNPREYSEKASSYASSAHAGKPQQHGPLLEFNRHPDSWMIVAHGTDYDKVLPANFRRKIVTTRWIQLILRVTQFLAAIGLFVCIVCIKGTVGNQSWILRLPPPWDAILCAYSIYHLARSARSRTPSSSSSYQWFSLCMDIGLIPFYVYATIFTQSNFSQAENSPGRWTTYFPATSSTNIVLLTAWVTSTTLGITHLLSACLDVCLGLWFRKLAMLPPDMNPLEPKIKVKTSKHQHKNSESSSEARTPAQTRPTSMGGSTLKRASTSHSSIPRGFVAQDDRTRVSFASSRVNGNATFSPHTLVSVQSYKNLQSPSQALSTPSLHSRTVRHDSPPPEQSTYKEHYRPTATDARSVASTATARHTYTRSLTDTGRMPEHVQGKVDMSEQQQNLLRDNWFANNAHLHERAQTLRPHDKPAGYDHQIYQDHPAMQAVQSSPDEPLRSNPPDSMKFNGHYHHISSQEDQENYDNVGRALTMGSSLYSESLADLEAPNKEKYYGDLHGPRSDASLRQVDGNRIGSGSGVELPYQSDHRMPLQQRHVSGRSTFDPHSGWQMRKREISGTA